MTVKLVDLYFLYFNKSKIMAASAVEMICMESTMLEIQCHSTNQETSFPYNTPNFLFKLCIRTRSIKLRSIHYVTLCWSQIIHFHLLRHNKNWWLCLFIKKFLHKTCEEQDLEATRVPVTTECKSSYGCAVLGMGSCSSSDNQIEVFHLHYGIVGCGSSD